MMDDRTLTRRQILSGLAIAGSSGALVGSGTSALFADEETFGGTTLAASSTVTGVVDVDVTLERGESLRFEISLPKEGSPAVEGSETAAEAANNPARIWVRSKSCPAPTDAAANLGVSVALECDGESETIADGQSLLGVFGTDTGLSMLSGERLSCDDSCLHPGETRTLVIDPEGTPAEPLGFELEFYAQQCRYQDGTEPPFDESRTLDPDECGVPGTGGCPVSDGLAFDATSVPSRPFGTKGLSFVAFYGDDLADEDVTLDVTARNEDGEPTRLFWSSGDTPVDRVAWKYGSANSGGGNGGSGNGGNDDASGNDNGTGEGTGNDGGTFTLTFEDGATAGSVYSDPDRGVRVDGPQALPAGGLKYEAGGSEGGPPALGEKAGSGLPHIKREFNALDGIDIDERVLDRGALDRIDPVPADLDAVELVGRALVGSNGTDDAGEPLISVWGDVSLSEQAALVGGRVSTSGSVDIDTGGAVAGGIDAVGDVDLEDGTVIGDVVSAGDDVTITATGEQTATEIFGSVRTSEGANIDIDTFATITGDVDAAGSVAGVQNSKVGGTVTTRRGDCEIPSSVICGDVVVEGGSVDVDSTKTGPPKEGENSRNLPRERSLVGGAVRVRGGDCDVDATTVRGRDGTALEATGGNGVTVTNGSTVGGDIRVEADTNVDVDGGSRIEGSVVASAGTVSLTDVTVTGDVQIGPDGEVGTLDSGSTVEGDVIVEDGGTLDVSGAATIEGDVRIKGGGKADIGESVTVNGEIQR